MSAAPTKIALAASTYICLFVKSFRIQTIEHINYTSHGAFMNPQCMGLAEEVCYTKLLKMIICKLFEFHLPTRGSISHFFNENSSHFYGVYPRQFRSFTKISWHRKRDSTAPRLHVKVAMWSGVCLS